MLSTNTPSNINEGNQKNDSELQQKADAVQSVRRDTEAITGEKLSINSSYEQLETAVPEVAAMKGYDQRSDYHSLTLDEHTKEVVRQMSENQFVANHPKRELIVLAGMMHDIGKMSPDGHQVHPKDPSKMQYLGHEKESQRMADEALGRHFELSPEDKDFVAKLIGLHASALNLINNFSANNSPKGKDLKSYDEFVARVEDVPGAKGDLEGTMRIVFAINRSDKMSGYNAQSDFSDPKVMEIKKKSDTQVATLDQMGKALPALLKAIQKRREGDQTAGIVRVGDEYFYNKDVPVSNDVPTKKQIPDSLKPLGRVLRNKLQAVADSYDDLKAKKDNPEAVNAALKNLALDDEQAKAVLAVL